MFSVLKKFKKLNLSVDVQLQVFDCMVSPILLYSSGVYGYKNLNLLNHYFYNSIR